MDNNFADLLFAFKEHLRVKNYSPATIRTYSDYLQRFFSFLSRKEITDIRQVSRQMLKDYQLKLTEHGSRSSPSRGKSRDRDPKPYTSATIAINIRAIKRFFEYLEKTNQILINPAEHLKEPKKETRLPHVVLSKEEAMKILEQPNLSTLRGIRDRTILEVFYSTKIRGQVRSWLMDLSISLKPSLPAAFLFSVQPLSLWRDTNERDLFL